MAADGNRRTVLDLGIQVADGLDVAHAEGGRAPGHQTCKPICDQARARQDSRLWVGEAHTVGTNRRKRTGVSHHAHTPPEELLTSPGMAVGTVAYMSPEQVRGKELDARSDLFSFGVVLYEMATGVLPFRGDTREGLTDAILNQCAGRFPVRLNPNVSAELERIINKALEKDRDLRYQHASDIRTDLKRLRRDTDSDRISTSRSATVQELTAEPRTASAAAVLPSLGLAAEAGTLFWPRASLF